MLVIVDAEWVSDSVGNDWLTQLYAERVDPDWQAVSVFSSIIRPPSLSSYSIDLPAFNGHELSEYMQGEQELAAIERFAEWLKADDELCFWHQGGIEMIRGKWHTCRMSRMENKTGTLQRFIQSKLNPSASIPGNPYAIAEMLGIPAPVPAHCSVNDVSVIKLLCAFHGVPQDFNWNVTLPKRKKVDAADRKSKNADTIRRMHCNYFFALYGRVFHTKECGVLSHVKQLQGCVYYNTALTSRRPCLLCKPTPELQKAAADVKKEPAPKPPRPPARIVDVKLVSGEWLAIKDTRLVGCCHNLIHPGKITKAILNQHDCLGKQCRYFEKYEDSPYWAQLKEKQVKRQKAKQEKKTMKAVAAKEAEKMLCIGDELRNCIPEEESHMEIVRVERAKRSTFIVFYVSDNRFADGDRFPLFLDATQQNHPGWKLRLRHIKDIDGHFVTRQEFHERKR